MRGLHRRARGFKKFLHNDALPYFSRDDYSEKVTAQNRVLSESEILKQIDAANEIYTVLLHGPGGFGKTRLAHQLCQQATSDIALRIDASADYLKLKDYLQQVSSTEVSGHRNLQHIILFQDYAENVSSATSLRYFCDEVQAELNIRSTLIFCGRSSGRHRIKQVYDEFEIAEHSVGHDQEGNGFTYASWLVAQILE